MDELDIYRRQGFAHEVGFGQTPALLIIDFTYGFTDADPFGGGNIGAAIERTQVLLEHARTVGMPIAFTRVVYADDGSDVGTFCLKVPALKTLTETAQASQIVAALSPRAGEHIVRKTQASAFFGTGLAPWLTMRGVDTLLVTGCTTSGCVRASVIDSCSHNFRTIVVSDCVGDRAHGPHEANLFDMEQKYADVAASERVMQRLRKAA